MTHVWIDGELLDAEKARVSPFDHGLLTGDGVFETLRVYRGQPFAARRHLERLASSAAAMGLPCPPADVLRLAMAEVVDADGLESARLRITVTGGPAPLGGGRGDAGPTVIVAGGALPDWPPATAVVTVPWPRNERSALVGVKTISYGENVVALAYARERGAGEAIFANLAGNLCEGTGTNVFVAVGGRLVTPPLSSGCLAGVTRDLLLELLDVEEADVPLSALASAGEAFLSSSTREVQPISAVDGQVLPTSADGGFAGTARIRFRDLVQRDIDP
ncbi:MAG: branched-chain amino acid aminotransferase [Actinomycetota bacterium]|jgi:branched-chain amino acid aminotransferase|nr:branched-chain amino acid aminotransferase [Actinomycetota bacterium]